MGVRGVRGVGGGQGWVVVVRGRDGGVRVFRWGF